MINLSSFIAFHARRTPDRCALKYRGEDISYADFDLRIRQVAVVVLADDATLDLSDVADHCRPRLAAFKVPKQLIIRDSLPRNPSGKVLKRVLHAELEATA